MTANERAAESDAVREMLIDFAVWMGDSRDNAEWSAESYLMERAS